MRKILSVVIVFSVLLEIAPVNIYASENKLKIGFLGVFVSDREREDSALSAMVSPMFSDSSFFTWERITKDTPTTIFWGIAKIDARFQHNDSNVSGKFTLYMRDPISGIDMFILDATGVSSNFSGMVVDWSPFEKEALLNALAVLSRKIDDLWRSNSIVTYSEGKVFECDLGQNAGIVEGSLLSVFRDNRLIAKGKVTSLDQKKCKAEIIYSSGKEPPVIGDKVKIAYIPPTPEVSFVNQTSSILSAIAGIAILAGVVVLYNIARTNASPKITLISPTDGMEFNSGETINFTWLSNQSMESYKIQIIKSSTNEIFEDVTSDASYSYSIFSPGTYSWKVIGYKTDGTFVESETRTFYIVP